MVNYGIFWKFMVESKAVFFLFFFKMPLLYIFCFLSCTHEFAMPNIEHIISSVNTNQRDFRLDSVKNALRKWIDFGERHTPSIWFRFVWMNNKKNKSIKYLGSMNFEWTLVFFYTSKSLKFCFIEMKKKNQFLWH